MTRKTRTLTDRDGAKFRIAIVRAPRGWFWHEIENPEASDEIAGPFPSEKAALADAKALLDA